MAAGYQIGVAERAVLERGVGEGDHLHLWPDAGHLLRMGYLPTDIAWSAPVAFGGTRPGTAAAQADLGPRVLEFLAAHAG